MVQERRTRHKIRYVLVTVTVTVTAHGCLVQHADLEHKAIYYGCATLSGSFSGLIAFGIQKNLTLEATGKESWRWLFIIEGSLAMFVGLLALLLLPNFPEQLRGKKHWLYRPDEIEVAINRLRCK